MEHMRKIRSVAARQGPTAALEVLYRAEYTGMVRLAYTLVGSNAEAEEIVQDSFVEVSRRIADLGQQPGGYLRTVVVSRCRSALRRRRVMGQHASIRPRDLTPEAESLWDVLEHLTEQQRIAVVLRYYCGCNASEIAAIVDQPAATVRSHLRRALVTMRREIVA
jgi:RNA polymerase sigma-70 factor (ECF subfamily)